MKLNFFPRVYMLVSRLTYSISIETLYANRMLFLTDPETIEMSFDQETVIRFGDQNDSDFGDNLLIGGQGVITYL